MATIGSLGIDIVGNASPIFREFDKVSRGVNNLARNVHAQNTTMQRGFTAVGTAVKGFATALGGLVTIAGAVRLANLGRDALDAAGNLGEMAQQAGVSVKALQQLEFAGVQVGVSAEKMATNFGQLTRRLGEAARGKGELVGILKQYKIAATDASGNTRDAVEVFADLAEVVANTNSAGERARIAYAALGRSGRDLLPVLALGRQGFLDQLDAAERLGLVLGKEFVDAADRASDHLGTLQYAVSKGFQVGFVQEFAGAILPDVEARWPGGDDMTKGTAVALALLLVAETAAAQTRSYHPHGYEAVSCGVWLEERAAKGWEEYAAIQCASRLPYCLQRFVRPLSAIAM